MAEEIKCPHCNKSIEDVVNDEKIKRENLKYLYKRYCDCRDKELDNFWKKTTYIWTVIGLCFTGYGALMSKNMDSISSNFLLYNSIICAFGIALSYIWLWMSKATKAWYEVFEAAIWDIESYEKEIYPEKHLIHNYWYLKTDKDFLKKNKMERMLSTRDFSPSKIVIVIGWMLVAFWILTAVCGVILTIINMYIIYTDIFEITINILPLLVLIPFAVFVPKNLKSSTLRDFSAQELFKHIANDPEIKRLQLYFEVHDNEVCFFTTNQEIIQTINEYYIITPCNYYSNKTAYDFNLINAKYVEKNNDDIMINEIKRKFENMKINVKNVAIFDKVLCVNLEGKNYVKDNEKISKEVSNLMKQNVSVKINYELIK